MKNLLILVFLSGFIFLGCSKNESILSPAGSSNFEQNTSLSSPNWIKLNLKNKSLSKSAYQMKQISWYYGGNMQIAGYNSSISPDSYDGLNDTWDTPWVKASMEWPAQSWDKEVYGTSKYFYFRVDDYTCTSTFYPSMQFTQPIIHNVKYTGLDLTGVNPDNVRFAYLAWNGALEDAKYDELIVDIASGTLQVVNAQIPHFSRYGFTE